MNGDENPELVCLNRLIGKCSNCTPDYDSNHHPNNYDCPGYRPTGLILVNIVEPEGELEEMIRY